MSNINHNPDPDSTPGGVDNPVEPYPSNWEEDQFRARDRAFERRDDGERISWISCSYGPEQ